MLFIPKCKNQFLAFIFQLDIFNSFHSLIEIFASDVEICFFCNQIDGAARLIT
jgi:hypothetical protein